MSFEMLSVPAVILVSMTSMLLLLVWDWRWSLLVIFTQYIGVFILVGLSWPVQMAAAKLLAGWMSIFVLCVGRNRAGATGERRMKSSGSSIPQTVYPLQLSAILFRLVSAILVGLVVFSIRSIVLEWIPELDAAQAYSSFLLMGLGLLHLGLTTRPLGIILGLLTVLCGFEILYASVEVSALVEGIAGCGYPGFSLDRRVYASRTGYERGGMSAPIIWIFIPGVLSIVLFGLHQRQNLVLAIGAITAFLLAVLAWAAPIGGTIAIGSFTFELGSTLTILGRRFILDSNDRYTLNSHLSGGCILVCRDPCRTIEQAFYPTRPGDCSIAYFSPCGRTISLRGVDHRNYGPGEHTHAFTARFQVWTWCGTLSYFPDPRIPMYPIYRLAHGENRDQSG